MARLGVNVADQALGIDVERPGSDFA
jgi:hypothetical protein